MHILFGLAVATVLVIGWFAGNLFVCVFLSLPLGAIAAVFLLQTPSNGLWALVFAALVAGVWMPRYLRIRAAGPRYVVMRRPWGLKGQFRPFIKEAGAVVAICAAVTILLMPLFEH